VLDTTGDDHTETVCYNTNKHAAETQDPVHDAIMSRKATKNKFTWNNFGNFVILYDKEMTDTCVRF